MIDSVISLTLSSKSTCANPSRVSRVTAALFWCCYLLGSIRSPLSIDQGERYLCRLRSNEPVGQYSSGEISECQQSAGTPRTNEQVENTHYVTGTWLSHIDIFSSSSLLLGSVLTQRVERSRHSTGIRRAIVLMSRPDSTCHFPYRLPQRFTVHCSPFSVSHQRDVCSSRRYSDLPPIPSLCLLQVRSRHTTLLSQTLR